MSERKVNRDARTGGFVTEEYAEANPDTTVTETIEVEEVPDMEIDTDIAPYGET